MVYQLSVHIIISGIQNLLTKCFIRTFYSAFRKGTPGSCNVKIGICQSNSTKLTNNQVYSQHICLLMNNVYNLWSQSLLLVPLHPIFIKMFPFKKPSITALECPFDIKQYKVSKDLHEKPLFSTHFWIRQHIIFGENEWSLKLNRWNTTHKWNVNVNR